MSSKIKVITANLTSSPDEKESVSNYRSHGRTRLGTERGDAFLILKVSKEEQRNEILGVDELQAMILDLVIY